MGSPTTTTCGADSRKKQTGSGQSESTLSSSLPKKQPPWLGSVGNLELQYSSSETDFPQSNADWSFDPFAESISDYTNRDLVDAIINTEDWLATNGVVHLDHEAYLIRQKRLKSERQKRVGLGYLWLKIENLRQSFRLFQLITGQNGAFDVVSLENDELAHGLPLNIADRPIMTEGQFQSFLSAQRVPTVSVAEYLGRLQQSYANLRGVPDVPDESQFDYSYADKGAPQAHGVSGAVSVTNTRANLLRDAFSMRNQVARQGAIGEAYLLTSREALSGFGARNYQGIEWTHPTRGVEIGNHPLTDAQLLLGGSELSAKTRTVSDLSPFVQYATFLKGLSQMLDADPDYRGFTHYMNNQGRGRTPAQVRDQLSLRINADDAGPFRQLLSSPLARAATSGGNTSKIPNYQRAEMTRIYNGILQDRAIVLADGTTLNSVAAIDAALQGNRITAQEHAQHLTGIGQRAAAKVEAIPGLTTNTLLRFEAARRAVPNRMRPQDVRAASSPEYMHSLTKGGGLRGDLHAMKSFGGKGALFNAVFGMGREGFNMATDDKANPDAFERLARVGGREGLRGGMTSSLEALSASRASQYMLREGLVRSSGRAMAARLGSRAVPGGLVDMGFEGYDMLTDDRENSGKEVAYRLGRAFVIGAASSVAGATAGAWAGAAIGTAVFPGVGTVIGFVVGVLVGALVGFILGSLMESYEDMVMQQVPLKEFEKNIEQQSPGSIQRQTFADQELELMQRVVGGPKFRGPHNMKNVYLQRIRSTSPGDRMFDEELIGDRIHGGCQECHTRVATDRLDSMIGPNGEVRLAPVDRMFWAAMDESQFGGERGKFLGEYDLERQTVGSDVADFFGDDPAAEVIINSINVIQPDLSDWRSLIGKKRGGNLIPRGAINSPMSDQELYDTIKKNINQEQRGFENTFGEVGEDEYKLYRHNLKKAQEEQAKKAK
jgi:hypothetical protein